MADNTNHNITTNNESFLLKLAEGIHDEWLIHAPEILHEQLHPCYINSVAYLVTRKGLKQEYPEAYRTLVSISDKYGIRVFEDRRNSIKAVKYDKRKKLTLTVGLMLGMVVKTPALADQTFDSNHIPQTQTVALTNGDNNELNLSTHLIASKSANGKIRIGNRKLKKEKNNHLVKEIMSCFQRGSLDNLVCKQPNQIQVKAVEKILLNHLNNHSSKDEKIIKDIAYYYAQYPEVANLIKSLAEYNWTLNIQNKTWQASAKIQHGSVQQVDVYFDPKTAAQMLAIKNCSSNPICTVSPADALLHELLHAYIMLSEPTEYAQEHSHALYPMEHEHDIIKMENKLYSKMSKIDGLPRPNRHKHQASLVAVKCPVCI